MYTVDERDRVVELKDVPQSDVGAPCPLVFASEGVHPLHRPESYSKCRHFALTFHDSVFECVARSYTCELATGPLTGLVARMSSELGG